MSYDRRAAYMGAKRLAEARRSARLVMGAISSRTRKHRWHRIRTAPGLVSLQTGGGGVGPSLPTLRGVVTGWTARSKYRLALAVAMIEWPASPLVFVTLTYPRHFEADPAIWKEHLRRFEIAWARRWGQPRGVWAQEFQARGAVHFHLALVAPKGIKNALLRRWVAHVWYGIAGHGDERHLRQHLKPEHCKPADGPRGLISYLRRELGKERQKTLPDWLAAKDTDGTVRGAGRWWGVWGFDRTWRDVPVTAGEYQPIRRLLRRLLRGRTAVPRPGWKWECRTLFDKARRQWTLSHEVLRYLALLRDDPAPVATFLDFDQATRMRGAQLALGL